MTFFLLLRRFFRHNSGSIGLGLGLTMTMAAAATIGAVEIERMNKARSVMQDRLDMTVLHLGNTDDLATPQATGESYFRSQIDASDLDIVSMTPVFNYDSVTGSVDAVVDFEISSLMTGGFIDDHSLSVRSGATPRTKGNIEISMVLDVSGSMGWGFTSQHNAHKGSRRIDGMHEAAAAMFDKIYENPNVTPSVSVIPYADSVDISDLFAATSTGERLQGYRDANPHNILNYLGLNRDKPLDQVGMLTVNTSNLELFLSLEELSPDDLELRDRSHTMGVWAAERYRHKRGDGGYDIRVEAPSSSDQMPVFTEEFSELWSNFAFPYIYGREQIKVSPFRGLYYYGGTVSPTIGVLPMTTDTQAVRDYVASFQPRGGTAGHIGAAWGLYSLSPDWDGVFDHPAGTPVAWDESTEKYLVFMSDGQFNSQQDSEMDTDDLYAYFQSVCTKARSLGVRIFTVGLLLDDNTEQQLSQCAGNTGRFYSVDSRLQLVNAFKAVGREAGQLRLSY